MLNTFDSFCDGDRWRQGWRLHLTYEITEYSLGLFNHDLLSTLACLSNKRWRLPAIWQSIAIKELKHSLVKRIRNMYVLHLIYSYLSPPTDRSIANVNEISIVGMIGKQNVKKRLTLSSNVLSLSKPSLVACISCFPFDRLAYRKRVFRHGCGVSML